MNFSGEGALEVSMLNEERIKKQKQMLKDINGRDYLKKKNLRFCFIDNSKNLPRLP